MISSQQKIKETAEQSRFWRFAAPAGLAAVATLLEFGGEPLRLLTRYHHDRVADGELWRLISGHLVHLGSAHLAMNIAALAVLAVLFAPLLKFSEWLLIGFISALLIDAGLYFNHSSIEWYVGLSGVLHGFWAAAAMVAWERHRPEALPLTVLIVIKLIWELWFGAIPLSATTAGGPVITIAHAYGALGGALWSAQAIGIRRYRKRSL